MHSIYKSLRRMYFGKQAIYLSVIILVNNILINHEVAKITKSLKKIK